MSVRFRHGTPNKSIEKLLVTRPKKGAIMAIYLISDTHFGHKNLLRFERTEFNTVEEHDEFIIETINAIVKPTDTLIHLGDVGNVEMIRQLNGHKELILGNHDQRPVKEYLGYFAKVYETPFYFSKNILLSHDPHPVPDGVLNVHGHLHGAKMDSRNHFNISGWCVGYKPIRVDELYQMAAKLDKTNTRFLEEWYASKYQFLVPRVDVVTDENGVVNLEKTKELRIKLYASRQLEESENL